MIARFGGIFFDADSNLANRGSLEHVLMEVQATVFAHDVFDTLFKKAAAICWRIITGHVFHDGNKRTGMEACRLLLELNGYRMRIDSKAVQMALRVASGEVGFDDFVSWVQERTTKSTGLGPNEET